jgi:hypothetical protein
MNDTSVTFCTFGRVESVPRDYGSVPTRTVLWCAIFRFGIVSNQGPVRRSAVRNAAPGEYAEQVFERVDAAAVWRIVIGQEWPILKQRIDQLIRGEFDG